MRRQMIWGVMLLAAWPIKGQNETFAPESLTLGIFLDGVGENVMSYETGQGIWSGFEVEVMKQLVLQELADITIMMLRVPDLDSRITMLEDGTVDFVIGLFAVTPERLEQIDFAQPYYYSSGSVFFGVDSCPEGIESWENLNGTKVVIWEGYYAQDEILALGVIPIFSNTTTEGAKIVARGDAVGMIDNSVFSHASEGLKPCDKLESLWRVPAGVAVSKNNKPLRDLLSKSLLRLATGGDRAPLLRLEKDTFIAAGFPPNEDLAALVAEPTKPGALNPGFDDE